MTSKERIMRTLRGESVDRVPVCFYELNGYDQNYHDPDPFNVYNHPSWRSLLEMTKEQTDPILMRGIPFINDNPLIEERTSRETWYDGNGSCHVRTIIRTDQGELTAHTRRDKDIDSIWTIEHFVKDAEDFERFLSLPESDNIGTADFSGFLDAENTVGEHATVMVDMPDPLCLAAELSDMATYTILAMCEPELFERAMERFARVLEARAKVIGARLPGRLWRIYGPEYAARPYLPLHLFEQYVGGYDGRLIDIIHANGGYARIHAHGNISEIMPCVEKMGWDAIDPIEPPNQGDMALLEMRRAYGGRMVLFGNIEITEIENMPHDLFEKRVRQALADGTSGEGRGFVLMPSACPIGRILKEHTLRNYEIMVEAVSKF